jgi:hypothetical protein
MLEFVHRPLPIRFRHGPFAMDPCGRDPMQPGTLERQRAHDDATAACLLDATSVGREPCPHGRTDVPRGLVPHPQQRPLPCRCQPCRQPSQTRRCHGTDRPPVAKAKEQALGVRASQPITRDRLGLRGVPAWLVLDHGQRLGVGPGMALGWSAAAPPPLSLKPQAPLRGPQRERHQALAPLVFRAECGAGRVRPCFARFQWVCSCLRARRMVSSLRRRFVTPCSEPTSAARARGHPPVGVP